MLVSYNWISEYLDLDEVSTDGLGKHYTLAGLEVEEILVKEGNFDHLVVGRVISCEAIPETKLSLTQVDVGRAEPQQIVCGAPNVAKDQLVITALPGTVLPGNFEIGETTVHGHASNGMLVSLQELGFSENVVPKKYAEGIYVFPAGDNIRPGDAVSPLLGLDDAIYDIDLTPNRADALSMRGVAYETGALLSQKPEIKNREVDETSDLNTLEVKISDRDAAPVYSMRVIDNLKVKESPMWLQRKLMAAGMRPIDNLVDVTNYIMLEYGQPLHAFDLDKIKTGKVEVRRAYEGEKTVTLDQKERVLNASDIVITDGEEIIGLAGVMGGANSDIADNTQRVVLEAAVFDPTSIRKTAQRLNLRSEASGRFEKGINESTVIDALNHAAQLLAELGDGKVLSGVAGDTEVSSNSNDVIVTLEYLENIIGIDLSVPVIRDIINRLGFEFKEITEEEFKITIPGRRWDINIPADVAEEVARIYGYNNIPATLPVNSSTQGELTHMQKTVRMTNSYLESVGLNQAITYSLLSKETVDQFSMFDSEDVTLEWPMSEEHDTLRKSLIPGLLNSTQYNRARSMKNVFLYETGRIYQHVPGQVLLNENEHVAGVLMGNMQDGDWINEEVSVDFYTVKGIVESLFELYNIVPELTFVPLSDKKGMHPGRTAMMMLDNEKIGFIGQIHPNLADEKDLEDTYIFEFNLEAVLNSEEETVIAQEVPRYPGITRDMALLLDEEVTHKEVIDVIKSNAGTWLKDVKVFDLYQGDRIEEGKKSVAYSLFYLNPSATLVEEDVTEDFEKTQKAIIKQLNAEIR